MSGIKRSGPRDIPVIFSAPMVCGLREGRKTMTRRLGERPARKGEKVGEGSRLVVTKETPDAFVGEVTEHWRPSAWALVKPGTRLWVRENFSGPREWESIPPGGWGWDTMVRPDLWYWADGNPSDGDWTKPRPSIHMPRWASRLTLVVKSVKVEHLCDISPEDAIAEGVFDMGRRDGAPYSHFHIPGINLTIEHDPEPVFLALWSSLHGPESVAANPVVAAISFDVYRKNIDAMEGGAA